MSEPFQLQARVEIDYKGRVVGVLVHDGKPFYDSSLMLYMERDAIEVKDLRDSLEGEDDE